VSTPPRASTRVAPATSGRRSRADSNFFDLRELQETITAKQLWATFADLCPTEEQVDARFMQIAELRNAIRHSRTLTDVAIKDGEAALAWFATAFRAERTSPAQAL